MDNTGSGPSAMMLSHSQKVEEYLRSIGLRIKHYEDRVALLQGRIQLADDAVRGMQATLRLLDPNGSSRIRQDEDIAEYNQRLLKQIDSAPDSAVALISHLTRPQQRSLSPTWINDVVGIVASIVVAESDILNRILSDYLGQETMLAVVCKTQACVRELESYKKGLEGVIICLEKIRPYAGEFVANDPQKRLDLLQPRLPNGETPAGFVGFAVNLVHFRGYHVGLRQTLFWKLFSRLQVYQTKAHMLQALPFLVDGAVSLDGAAIPIGSANLCLRKPAEAGLRFLATPKQRVPPEHYYRLEKSLKEKMWERELLVEDLQWEKGQLKKAKADYEEKKQEFIKVMAEIRSPRTAPQEDHDKLDQKLKGVAPFKKD